MLKKSLIVIGVLAVVMVAVLFYLRSRGRTLSPPGKAEITNSNLPVNPPLSVSISYSRPSVRGRVIFGTKEQGALQPYGVYWRLGANESTEITISRDVLFGGLQLKKGTYKMYAIPGPEKFEIRLNSELDTWGYAEADPEKDVLTVSTLVEPLTSPVEQLTISLQATEAGAEITVEFEKVHFSVTLIAVDLP